MVLYDTNKIDYPRKRKKSNGTSVQCEFFDNVSNLNTEFSGVFIMDSAWKNLWSIGNAIIDSEHRNLLVMAYNIESIIKKGDISVVLQELEQFEYWLCDHFENEEEIALAVNFDFFKNELEHQNLLEEFHRMKDELMSYGNTLPDNAAKRSSHFLDEWLVAHILKEDMLMKPMLQAHAYNFMPDHKTKFEASLANRVWNGSFR